MRQYMTWCDASWCSATWCAATRNDATWRVPTQHYMTWHYVTRHDMARRDATLSDAPLRRPTSFVGLSFFSSVVTEPGSTMYILMQVFKKFITSQFGHYYTFYFIIWYEKRKIYWERQRGFFLSFKKWMFVKATFFIALNAIKVILTFIWIIYFTTLILQNSAWRHSASSLICSPV